jgi:hypothetical protein
MRETCGAAQSRRLCGQGNANLDEIRTERSDDQGVQGAPDSLRAGGVEAWKLERQQCSITGVATWPSCRTGAIDFAAIAAVDRDGDQLGTGNDRKPKLIIKGNNGYTSEELPQLGQKFEEARLPAVMPERVNIRSTCASIAGQASEP